jgi:hypothetical protein
VRRAQHSSHVPDDNSTGDRTQEKISCCSDMLRPRKSEVRFVEELLHNSKFEANSLGLTISS